MLEKSKNTSVSRAESVGGRRGQICDREPDYTGLAAIERTLDWEAFGRRKGGF